MTTALPTPAQIGDAFAQVLRDWLTPAQFREMRRINRTQNKGTGICASHDYCDANMAMDQAWRGLGLPSVDADDEAQAALWNAAWDHAFKAHLS